MIVEARSHPSEVGPNLFKTPFGTLRQARDRLRSRTPKLAAACIFQARYKQRSKNLPHARPLYLDVCYTTVARTGKWSVKERRHWHKRRSASSAAVGFIPCQDLQTCKKSAWKLRSGSRRTPLCWASLRAAKWLF